MTMVGIIVMATAAAAVARMYARLTQYRVKPTGRSQRHTDETSPRRICAGGQQQQQQQQQAESSVHIVMSGPYRVM